jgi:hypothetical protein
MSKEDWYSDQRTPKCIQVFTEQVKAGNVNESTSGVDICNLNSDLNNMCIALKSAQTMVFTANCIYSGDCSPRIAVYTPGMYSITNGDFVRGTVGNYYEVYNQQDAKSIDSNRVVCPMDDQELEMRARNAEYTSQCASVQLQVLKIILNYMREILHILVQAAFIVINLGINLLRLCLMVGQNVTPIMNDIQFWFLKLINLLDELLKTVGDMFYQIIFDTGGLGSVMKDIIKALCMWVNMIYNLWETVYCVFIHNIAQPILRGLADVLNKIKSFLTTLGIDGIRTKLNSAADYLQNTNCTKTMFCDFPEQAPPGVPDGTLPVPTRCWANYIAEIDETNALSCSRSDTCRSAMLASGQSQESWSVGDNDYAVCDSCPRNNGVNQFGCNTYTQQCTCSQPVLARTYCTTNSQCYQQGDEGSICALVNDFSTGSSHGAMECAQCEATPTCHILQGNGVGVCSCMQQATPVQTCSSPLLSAVMPDASQMCVVDMDIASMSTTNAFYDWNSLATTPCVLISSGNANCYSVGAYGNLVVGHGVSNTPFAIGFGSTSTNRRLLQSGPHNYTLGPNPHYQDPLLRIQPPTVLNTSDALQQGMLLFQHWDHITEPCSSLAIAYLAHQDIGIMGEHALANCVHWRQIGNQTIQEMNLTKLEDNDQFLMSIMDFASAIREKGALKELIDTPGIWRSIFFQLKVVKPLQKIFARIAEHFVALHIEAILQLMNYTSFVAPLNHLNISRAEKDFRLFVENKQHTIKYLMPYMPSIDLEMLQNLTINETTIEQAFEDAVLYAFKTTQNTSNRGSQHASTHSHTDWNTTQNNSRRNHRQLLQYNPVTTYSSVVAQTDKFSNIMLGDAIAETWLQGPFGWPPKYTQQTSSQCSAASELLNIMYENGLVLKKFYHDDYASKFKSLPWDISTNLPKLYKSNTSAIASNSTFVIEDSSSSSDVVAAYFLFVGNSILKPLFGVTPGSVKEFFLGGVAPDGSWSAKMLLQEVISCDFESVMLCSRHNRNVFISLIISIAMYLAVSGLMSIFQLGSLSGWFLLAVIPMTAWLSYGMSPFCAPMIPTCVLQDVIDTVQVSTPSPTTKP